MQETLAQKIARLEREKAGETLDQKIARLEAARAAQPSAEQPSLLRRVLTDTRGLENAADAAMFGVPGLAADAIASMGDKTFTELRDEREARKNSLSVPARIGSALVGGIGGAARLGTGSVLDATGRGLRKIGASRAARVLSQPSAAQVAKMGPFRAAAGATGRGFVEGAAQGGLQALGESIGTSDGVGDDVAGGILFGGPLGAISGGAARQLGRRSMAAADESAARRALEARQADEGLNYTVPLHQGTGMPERLAGDVEGPTMLANARGAARSTAGRTEFERAFGERDAAMPSALTGDVEDAALKTRQLRQENRTLGRQEYDAARAATEGNPIQSEALTTFMQSPIGRSVWMEVQSSRANRLGAGNQQAALPSVTRQVPTQLAPPNSPYLLTSEAGEIAPASLDELVPDAEAIHQMKRLLRRRASMETGQAPATGARAISAQDALDLLDVAQRELPEPFRAADAAYAGRMGDIDALNRGRRPVLENPDPTKRRPSLSETEADVGAMSPERRDLFRTGKTFDLASRVRSGALTPASAAGSLRDPRSPLSREMALSGSNLGDRLEAWNDVGQRQGSIVSGEGETLLHSAGDPIAWFAQKIAAPTAPWMAVKGAKELVTSGSTRAKVGAADAAFARLFTSKNPAAIDNAIQQLIAMGVDKNAAAQLASIYAGRVGGNLRP